MRHSSRNVKKPVRFREGSDDSTDSDLVTVNKTNKREDLRKTLNRKGTAETSGTDNDVQELSEVVLDDSDAGEKSLNQDNSNTSNQGTEGTDSGDDSNTANDSDRDYRRSKQKKKQSMDQNNNASRVQSVVVETNKRKSVERQVTVLEGEPGSSGWSNSDKEPAQAEKSWVEVMDNPNDDELTAFFEKHEERLRKMANKKQPHQDTSGEFSDRTNCLAENIQRLSMIDKNAQVLNSRSEDTIYSNLVKQRREVENQERENSRNKSDSSHDNSRDSQQINSSTDSSLDKSDLSEVITDETDKEVVMEKFVNNSTHNDYFVDEDRSPSPKIKRRDKEKR